eukprot:456182_1
MFASLLFCLFVAGFQPICVSLLKIPIEKLEVSGQSLFIDRKLFTVISAGFIHDGVSHALYNILTVLPMLTSLEAHFGLSFLCIIMVTFLSGIFGFICSISYNYFKHGSVGLFIPHCGFSHSMYGICLFMCYLYPYSNQFIPSLLTIHPLVWLLFTYILPDFFSKSPKHNKLFWLLFSYLILVICWVYYKINIDINHNINAALYLFLFDVSFIKSKLYYRLYLGLPSMCDHCGHLCSILFGIVSGMIYDFVITNNLSVDLSINHFVMVFSQWPLCATIIFSVYRLYIGW